MAWLNRKFDVQAVLRPAGFLLLSAMFLMQALLPAAASIAMDCHTDTPAAAHCPDDCTVHAADPDDAAHVTPQTEGEPGTVMQCMAAMCSVHVSVEAPMPALARALLSASLWAEDGAVLSSLSRATQDRPPQNI